MDKDERSSGGLPGGGLIVVTLLAAGALFVSHAPLETSRPTQTEPYLDRTEAAQDVDARLWQDPFGAVASAREKVSKQGGAAQDPKRHGEQQFADELRRQADAGGDRGVVVLAVMLYGGPYTEQAESRRRTRQAVLSGLSASGFVPVDNQHLGYFYTHGGEGLKHGLPETVPFESFQAVDGAGTAAGAREPCKGCRLVVVWLDSTAFYAEPLRKLSVLAQRAAPQQRSPDGPGAVRWRVLGPPSSDGLRALIDEVDGAGFKAEHLKRFDFRIFSGTATVPDAVLLADKGDPGASVAAYLDRKGVSLLRTIGSDDQLAGALIYELNLRGVSSGQFNRDVTECPERDRFRDDDRDQGERLPSSIAIISEWDTLYGRSLVQPYATGGKSKHGFCVTRWHYVRGLDGRLPGDSAPAASADGRAKKDPRGDAAEATPRDGTYIERPEGQSQFDYLRRLANRIRDEDAELRRRYGREYGIRAIGVLGNDVYDKLLVLQALQGAMPHAVFFTTDLDARLFHPREQAWTRNLVVASSFGLELADPLQRSYAPFRDSYQTSTFFSTMLALDDAGHAIANAIANRGQRDAKPRWTAEQVKGWFATPRIFEISRSGVFDFSPGGGEPAAQAPHATPPLNLASTQAVPLGLAPPAGCGRGSIEQCAGIHPKPSPMAPELPVEARYLIAAALLTALWVPALALGRGNRRAMRRFVAVGGGSRSRREARAAALVVVLAALVLLPPLWLALSWPGIAETITQHGFGKPLRLTEGISPWPTYAIRLATLVLCLYFVAFAWSTLAANADRIARDFRLGATRRHLESALAAEAGEQSLGQRIGAMLSVRFFRERPTLLGPRSAMTPAATQFWKHYLVQNRAGARVLRAALCTAVLVALGLFVERVLGDAPIAPYRGDLTWTMQPLTTWTTTVAIQFLLFFIVDATLLSVLFVRGLRLHHANWPERTLQAFEARTGVPRRFLDDWIDLEFVARRTQSIGRLIYLPFIVLSLMLLARSAFFDDWYLSPSVVVMSMLSFGIVLLGAFALRRTAEASRRQALERVRDAVMRARGDGDTRLAGQLDALRERIERLREGAFASYAQQPLLKAALLPFLTYGGSSLFDYLTMLNL
jgi:hypothetical protein